MGFPARAQNVDGKRETFLGKAVLAFGPHPHYHNYLGPKGRGKEFIHTQS